MDNGFTGTNFEMINSQQRDFVLAMLHIKHHLQFDIDNFFRVLRKNWASQNAVKFAQETKVLVCAYLNNIKTYAQRINDDISSSIFAYARVLNEDYTRTDYTFYEFGDWSFETPFVLDATNHNGVTGMNIKLVEDALIYELPKIKQNALFELNNLPSRISVFDANGEQQAAYSTRKQAIRDLVEELLTEIETQIRSYIETEKNNILLAKQQVVQNMNGSNTTNA